MGILFAKSATKSQKVGLSLMLLVVLMSMLGICHGALVNELIIKYGAVVALLLSLVCTPLTVRTVLRNQHLKLSRKPGKRLLIVIG